MAAGRINEMSIPYIHPKVELSHINENGKLLTDRDIRRLKRYYKTDGRVSKKNNGTPYTLIVRDGQYFAVYLGVKHTEYGEDGKALGRGNFGKAKLAQNLDTGEWYVVKAQKKSSANGDEVKMLDELKQLVRTRANNLSVVCTRQFKNHEQQDILIKLARGTEVYSFVMKHKILPLWQYLDIAIGGAREISKLLAQDILHRDMKFEHVFYDQFGECTLIDFGFATKLVNGAVLKTGCVGTWDTMAPEVFKLGMYSEKSEVYALGISIAELLQLDEESVDKFYRYKAKLAVTEEESERFNDNECIPDTKLRKKIRTFLWRMTFKDEEADDYGASERPSILEVIEFFSSLKNELAPEFRKKSIVILDTDEYEKIANNASCLKELHASLQNYQEIWLIDSGVNKNPQYYARIKCELEQHGVTVSPILLRPQFQLRNDVIAECSDHIAVKYPDMITEFFHLTSAGIVSVNAEPSTGQNTKKRKFENVTAAPVSSMGIFSSKSLPTNDEYERALMGLPVWNADTWP